MFIFGLTIVRHGETQYNKDKLLQGQGIDTPLSAVGLQQAEAAGQYLRETNFSHALTSDLQRARQTAEIILRNNARSPGLQLLSEPLLRERGFGIAEGRPKEDLKNMANAAGQACRDYTPPGGETLEQVKTRVRKFLGVFFKQMADDLRTCGRSQADGATPMVCSAPEAAGLPSDVVLDLPAHALVVSHGAYIRVAVRHLVEDLGCSLPPDLKMAHVFSPCPNTGLCRFIITLLPSETGFVPSPIQCLFINRTEHLSMSKQADQSSSKPNKERRT